MTGDPNIHYLPGTLYNIILGVHPLARDLMRTLELSATGVGRFRDCYLQRSRIGELEIHLVTRNGGANRAAYELTTKRLRQHPLYLRDADGPLDTTYATYVFSVPEAARRLIEMAFGGVTSHDITPELVPKPWHERLREHELRMKTDPNDPEVRRVSSIIRPVLEAIRQSGAKVSGLLDDDSTPVL
jgi:hypothetical protein